MSRSFAWFLLGLLLSVFFFLPFAHADDTVDLGTFTCQYDASGNVLAGCGRPGSDSTTQVTPSQLPTIGQRVDAFSNCVTDSTHTVCADTRLDTNIPLPTPSGWSSPTSPPSTAASTVNYGANGLSGVPAGTRMSSPGEFCQYAGPLYSPGLQAYQFDANGNTTGNTGVCEGQNQFGSWNTLFVVTGYVVCPTGYSMNSGTCTLSNPSVVMKPSDGACAFVRTGNSYSGDPLDPDCLIKSDGSTAASATHSSASGGTVTSASGNTTTKTVVNDDGSTVTTVSTANNDGTTTVIKVAVAAPGGAGGTTVTGTSKSTVQGTGTLQGAGAGGSGGTGDQPVTPCGLGGSGSPPCEIDEHPEVSQQNRDDANAGGKSYSDALDAQKQTFDAASGSGNIGDLGIPGVAQFVPPTSADDSGGLQNAIPAGGGCTPIETSISGVPVTFDYCPMVAYLRPFIDWGAAALTGLYIWGLFYRKERKD